MSKHEQAIQEFLTSHLTWERYQLRQKLNNMFDAEETAGLNALGFIPDAFEIDKLNKTVRLLEVDGHSYTDSKKMGLICEFWYDMDARSWLVELHTLHLFTGASSIMTDSDLTKEWHNRVMCNE
jgi:hypothetical protein